MTTNLNSRFSEECRDDPLGFLGFEDRVFLENNKGDSSLACETDLYIGVFFDGTNNNKYRDAPGYGHSNVARLYEVFPGTPANQTSPTLQPRMDASIDGSTGKTKLVGVDRKIAPESGVFGPASVPKESLQYYRKIYVPGVGTPMPDVMDDGRGIKKKGGLGMALLGQARLDWALLQLINQTHAAAFGVPLERTVQLEGIKKGRTATSALEKSALLALATMINPLFEPMAKSASVIGKQLEELALQGIHDNIGYYLPEVFERQFEALNKRLTSALADRERANKQPRLRKIRLSVFGFSRGAAEARAWVNMVLKRFPGRLAGVTLQIDFLGLFDTVASVGLAQSVPGKDGHSAWASGESMVVPSQVGRCVHLVSAHEVRGSFPLDSICQSGTLPSNCKEIVYPGVHSDVGGGYPPNDQGRALGIGKEADARKLSQIPLAQMYREARMAGVPLAPPQAMGGGFRSDNFAIDSALKADFNAYVMATRLHTVPPTNGKGDPQYARMFPSEIQPRENLQNLVFRHYGYMLQWRRSFIDGAQAKSVAALPCLSKYYTETRHQDIEDLRGAEAELRKEIQFLTSTDQRKFDSMDESPFLNAVFDRSPDFLRVVSRTAMFGEVGGVLGMIGGALTGRGWAWIVEGFKGLFQEKQIQWDIAFKRVWNGEGALPSDRALAVAALYERHVHDSRAWFKALFRYDKKFSMAPDDEDWFVLGGRLKEQLEAVEEAEDARIKAARFGGPAEFAAARAQMERAVAEGAPLIYGGREPYKAWGYVRLRRIYEAGVYVEPPADLGRQERIDQEERARIREEMIEQENAYHAGRRQALLDEDKRYRESPRFTSTEKNSFTRDQSYRLKREDERHAEELARISRLP